MADATRWPVVTAEIKDQNGVAIPTPTLAFSVVNQVANEYKLTWSGPWLEGAGTPPWYLPIGDYSLVVTAIDSDGQEVSSELSVTSLVEVTRVELVGGGEPGGCSESDRCGEMTPNPQMDALPGQDPSQERPGGGRRVFAESIQLGALPLNRVKVRAIVEPTIPNATIPVYFASIDVDDPAIGEPDTIAGADNHGSPKHGTLVMVEKPSCGETSCGEVLLQVSGQPGDNYRVAASTSPAWPGGVVAVENTLKGSVTHRVDGTVLKPDETRGDQVSEMLTVWRTLHLEIDSMDAAPHGDHPERNFVEGTVRQIYSDASSAPSRIRFTGTSGTVDWSDDLDGSFGAVSDGRFQRGSIRLGTEAGGIIISPLVGNGLNYVKKQTGIQLPFQLLSPDSGASAAGLIVDYTVGNDMTSFTLDRLPQADIRGWTLSVAGTSFEVGGHVDANRISVDSRQPLVHHLRDDDYSDVPLAINTSLVQPSDVSSENIFAQAYVRPAFDLSNPRPVAPFNRNVDIPVGPDGRQNNLDLEFLNADKTTRDSLTSHPDFWIGYAQLAFQPDSRHDWDPGSEERTPRGETLRDWSYVYSEIIAEGNRGIFAIDGPQDVKEEIFARSQSLCVQHTLAHELAHQLGLPQDRKDLTVWDLGPLMESVPCSAANDFLTGKALRIIRMKGVGK